MVLKFTWNLSIITHLKTAERLLLQVKYDVGLPLWPLQTVSNDSSLRRD